MRRGAAIALIVASAARVAVLVWAWGRFPATADGHYYDVLADRLARGLGYTWAWPDGAVTYAAHYPVGYPAALSIAYRALGSGAAAAGALNLLLGVAASVAGWALARDALGPRAALAAALAAALEPALLLYQPAVMTEAVTAHLLLLAAWLVVATRRRAGRAAWPWLAALGVAIGAATLVRPQSLLFAPLFGAVALSTSARARVLGAALVTAAALVVCAPWTARHCARMGACALVSVNGGWNLLIGAAPGATGHWAPVGVPDECKTVFDEAKKDACFGAAARRDIARAPLAWLSLAPKKLAATFDYAGAAPYYLHASNPGAFSYRAKARAAVVETVFHRALLVGALWALARMAGPRRRARAALAVVGSACALAGIVTRDAAGGWIAHLALVPMVALLGRRALGAPSLVPLSAAAVGATALVHAVFFGAGRYSLPAFPFIALLAAGAVSPLASSPRGEPT
ncbi:MAG: glycosyltransferase family 39 protein [Polyangiaceae bacterium]|nr:glycosyltransferase family 39 protein [Polyangiaceae bacterium]